MSAYFSGAHACSVLVSAFCGDELQINVAVQRVLSFEKSSRRQNAFASTLQACVPQITAAAQADLTR
jgi:TctA family transporter